MWSSVRNSTGSQISARKWNRDWPTRARRPAEPTAQPERAARKADTANASPGNTTLSADERPRPKAADQTDDLLNSTEEELRGIAAPVTGSKKAAQPERTTRKTDTANAKPDS